MARAITASLQLGNRPVVIPARELGLPDGQPEPQGYSVVAVPGRDGADHHGVCWTHQRASRAYVSAVDATRWQCPSCPASPAEQLETFTQERQMWLRLWLLSGGGSIHG